MEKLFFSFSINIAGIIKAHDIAWRVVPWQEKGKFAVPLEKFSNHFIDDVRLLAAIAA